MRALAAAGVPVGVAIAPVIPGWNDHRIPSVLERAAAAGAQQAFLVLVRLPSEVLEVFEQRLREALPLRADKVLTHSGGWLALLAQVAIANAGMWFVIDRLQRPLTWWLDATAADRIAWLAVIIGAGAGAYFLVLVLLGLRPSKLGIRPH